MGNFFRRRNDQTTDEVDNVIHKAVDRVTDATRQALQTEGENLKRGYLDFQMMNQKKEDDLKKEIDDLKKQNADLAKENEKLKHDMSELTKTVKCEKEKIDKERELLEIEKEQVLSLTAPSYQARKMYGDVTPDSVSHKDIKSDFFQFFKHWIRHLPKENENIADTKSVQHSLTPLLQTCFNLSCNKIIEIMSNQLRELLQDPCNDSEDEKEDISFQERLRDICTAFSLLLYHANINTEDMCQDINQMTTDSFEKEVDDQMIKFPNEAIQKASEIAWSMVTQVPPMICSEPQKFSEKLHEIKECNWQVNDGPYELVYLRPVLFYGRHGAVAAQGQVGNQECAPETTKNFAKPENKEEVKEEPKPDETEDKESEGHEKVIIEEHSAGITKTVLAEGSKEKEDESKEKEEDTEINNQKDDFDLSLDKDTFTMISDDTKQNDENAEIPSNECNDEPNNEGRQKQVTEVNCITTDNNTETETSYGKNEPGELIQSSENGTVSVIPDEDKQNGKNQKIYSKEHNDEANNDHTQDITGANCVTSDDKIEIEIPNKAGVSDEPPAQSSDIKTVTTSDDKIETETPNEAGVSEEPPAQSSEIKTVTTSDDKIETETPNEAGVSEEPPAQSSEIKTVTTSDDKTETETPNEAGVSEEPPAQSSEIKTVTTSDDKIKTETPNEAGVSEEPPAQSSEIKTVTTSDDKIKTETPNEAGVSEEPPAQSSEIKTVTTLDDKIETETPNEAGVSEEIPAQSSESKTVTKIPDEDKQNGVTSDDKIETETPNEAGESEELVARSSEVGTVTDEDKQNGENHEIHFNETNDKANNVTHKEKTEANYVTTSDIDKQQKN